jgi:tRNA(Ile)-lysidine synthase
VTRNTLRDYNREHRLEWAEDPSNQNRDYARIRARDNLQDSTELRADLLATASDMRMALEDEKKILREQFALIGVVYSNGYIALTDIPLPELMLQLLRAVSGQNGLIDRAKIKRLIASMRKGMFKSATLGGALIAKIDNGFVICRDPVAVKGRRDKPKAHSALQKHLRLRLKPEPQIWDGRFSVHGQQAHMGVLHTHSDGLSKAQRAELKVIPAAARPTLPVVLPDQGLQHVGHYDEETTCGVVSLIRPRLEAALGGKLT